MAKRTASTWIEPDLYERLLRIAKVDRRSLAEVLAMSVEHGLPLLEQELSHKLTPSPTEAPVAAALEAAGAAIRKPRKRAAAPQP